jgi:hypothetical protein
MRDRLQFLADTSSGRIDTNLGIPKEPTISCIQASTYRSLIGERFVLDRGGSAKIHGISAIHISFCGIGPKMYNRKDPVLEVGIFTILRWKTKVYSMHLRAQTCTQLERLQNTMLSVPVCYYARA